MSETGEQTSTTLMSPSGYTSVPYGLTIITFSSILFYLLGKISTGVWLNVVRDVDKSATWKLKNTVVSFCHACVSGSWSLLCFYETPKIAEDMISTYSPFSYTLISFSVGYFLYDVIDMLLYQRTRQTYELIGHHFVILACYLVAITRHLYVGYAVVGLLVEVNSIFLHLRIILQLTGFSKDNSLYRLNSLINLGSFIVFRISLLAWMTRWIVINRDLVPLLFFSMGSIGLAIMTLMNIILFYRLLKSDFIRKKELKSKHND